MSRSRLQNPFLLVLQGFVAGAILFFALSHQSSQASPAPAWDSRLVVESPNLAR